MPTRPVFELPADPATWSSQELAFGLALAADEQKAEDVCVLGVQELLYVTDYFVLATTQSARQTKALADALNETAKKALGHKGRVEGNQRSAWLLIDLGNVVVHILTEEAREFYALDELWADADRYEITPEGEDESPVAEEVGSDAPTEE
ncbi:MAG: ribosome silencing factor [Planctomycetes bacterium]|nr:ribosome silencing factor [Planctomycetota bacterium]